MTARFSKKSTRPPSDQELRQEAERWSPAAHPLEGTPATIEYTSPEARERLQADTISVTIRMRRHLVDEMKRLALNEGLGYQTLLKRWLEDDLRRTQVGAEVRRAFRSKATAAFLDALDGMLGRAIDLDDLEEVDRVLHRAVEVIDREIEDAKKRLWDFEPPRLQAAASFVPSESVHITAQGKR